MTTTDLAAALLRDVPRYEPDNPLDSAPSMKDDPQGDWLSRDEVLAALSRALDPAIAEQAGSLVDALRRAAMPETADTITALLAQNAALRAQVRESALQELTSLGQAQEAYEAQKAAEAERDALRAERGAVLGMYMRSSDEGFRQKARAEAAETTLAAMTKERDAKVATDAVEQMIRNLRDCANGMGSFKTNRGDFGLCDDAADMISAIAAHRDALNILSAEDVAVHQEAISRAEAAEAQNAALTARVEGLTGALHNCVGMLDCLVAESGRSIEWGQEDPFRMGEWFEPDDLKQLAQARAALSTTTEEGHE